MAMLIMFKTSAGFYSKPADKGLTTTFSFHTARFGR